MAITWEFEITPRDIPNKIVRVKATRTDSIPPYEVSLQDADISTPEKKTEALNILWDKYLKKVEERATVAVIEAEISELETSAKTNFEGRT